ncbi:L-serine ammonia-lyase, iron-sulfur-dependent subunit beta [uncultured Tyzzerella sp.]|uniref:L-serine ammonia-lyase, iron-sulfur-dependent subunit beta n=1 Tax=uncultured Tyzzerella sp. TaxID=2321398 RepID=UPI002943D557|nr:L-serine ammonia-lyase, iron-sulfur-dependent subunit beta [uncultured Tyzzerella sp.]
MAFLSIFDVVGPNMVGPSSSHTAGAAAISLIAKKMFGKKISNVKFILYGSFAKTYKGHGTDKALLGGSLGFVSDDLRIRDSFNIAKELGVNYYFEESSIELDHPNIVDVCMESKSGDKMIVRGVSIGGGKVKIVAIDGTSVEFFGEYPTLIIDHLDKKGVIAFISNCLQDTNTNIAFMKVYRDDKGEKAHSIIECDDKINENIINILKQNENIINVMLLQI